MKHSKASNVIGRAFGLLKSYCLIYNFIHTVMLIDPLENDTLQFEEQHDDGNIDAFIDVVESSQQWISWVDNLASTMYNEWVGAICCHCLLKHELLFEKLLACWLNIK